MHLLWWKWKKLYILHQALKWIHIIVNSNKNFIIFILTYKDTSNFYKNADAFEYILIIQDCLNVKVIWIIISKEALEY